MITTTQQSNNPNNEVPPQDAQLQGVVSLAPKHNNQTQTMKLPPQDAQLEGVKPMIQYTTSNQMKTLKRKPPRASVQL
jgi:hypothetical protein